MIVLPENTAADGDEHDPPPVYATPPPPKVLVHLPQPPWPSDIKPTNHLSLNRRHGRIEGAFVIDPGLKMPAHMLAPLAKDETHETRRNLYLRAQNGSIDVDVWVLSAKDAQDDSKFKFPGQGRVRLGLSTQSGNISLRLHASPHPLNLSLHTDEGSVSLTLPRTFCGPLTIRLGYGRMHLSPALSAATTIFNESSKGVSRSFVGDFAESGWADAPGEWTGDEAQVGSDYGNVRIEFEDEWEEKKIKMVSFAVYMGGVLGVVVFGVIVALCLRERQ
ncbi:hypothetical protein C8F01DRAFT_1380633 [Mycena amicta]|nr:hypothetical protein C8F01DRAFT_1380633 [Mycena amicta]